MHLSETSRRDSKLQNKVRTILLPISLHSDNIFSFVRGKRKNTFASKIKTQRTRHSSISVRVSCQQMRRMIKSYCSLKSWNTCMYFN